MEIWGGTGSTERGIAQYRVRDDPDLERGRGPVRHLAASPYGYSQVYPTKILIIWDEKALYGSIYIGSIVWPSNSIFWRGWALVFGDLLSQSFSEKEC